MAGTLIRPCCRCGEPTTKPMYCGNACKVSAYKARHPEKVANQRAEEWRRHCVADGARVRTIVWMNKLEPQPQVRGCPDCGAALGLWQHRCDQCRGVHAAAKRRKQRTKNRAAPWYKARKRAERARRRALERGAQTERFDPIEVLERDGWRCHICGAATPKRLRGTFDDRAPELDHIVPLAAGGEHSRRNTACACRRCNIAKADKPLGQLRLVA